MTPWLDALHAEGPAADRADRMALYGQFVGSWDLDVTEFHDDGTMSCRPDRAADLFYHDCDPAVAERAVSALVAQHPDLKKHLYTEDGKLRAFVNLYVNDEDIRYLQKEATALNDGDNISIVPSIAGGA